MRIGVQAQLQVIFALIRPPYLGPAEKEALFRREPVDLLFARLWVLIERFLQRSISELDATNVCDVFALRQFAVNVLARQWLILRLLFDNRFATSFIFLLLLLLP